MPLSAESRRAMYLGRGFTALAAATFLLVVLGAVVRAHGAGLACPDWPLCFGEIVPRFDAKVGLEWAHRALAGGVTLGLAGLTLALARSAAIRAAIGSRIAVAWALLLVQVVLGGLTVLLELAPWTVTAHLLVGTAFCVVLLWTARDLAERAVEKREGGKAVFGSQARARARADRLPAGMGALILSVATLLGVEITLGGLVSSHAAGLACASFPTCDGRAWVPTLGGLLGLHVAHRLGALALTAAYVALAVAARRHGRLGLLAWSGLRLVIVQIVLGAANVLLRLPVEITALHSAVAAGLALVTALLVREWLWTRASTPAAEGIGLKRASAA